MVKVFLGGTCNNSTWRDTLIPLLKIDYFNPVVDDWTPECQEQEIYERNNCDYVLYVITSEMTGVYSIAEAVDDSNKRPRKTMFYVHEDGFNESQLRSLAAVEAMISGNGAVVCNTLGGVARYLNDPKCPNWLV